MSVGQAPFRRRTEAEDLWAHMQEEPPRLREHPTLDSVFPRGLAKDSPVLMCRVRLEFFEALSPVPLDHVPNPERDLVLGPDGGSRHVER